MEASDLLITTSELLACLDEPDVRVLDCRWSLADPSWGRNGYNEAHIPSAQYLALEHDLSDPAGKRGRHPLPTAERFAETLGSFGISNQSTVVTYDEGSCMLACRLWWMLRWVGHAKVRVLDGGLQQWEAHGYATSTSVVEPEPSVFQLGESITRICDANDLLDGSQTMLDARTQDRFDGLNESIDHTAGHIPGALCFPFAENQHEDLTFIREPSRFSNLDSSKPLVCYCGSGVSATHNILALLLAGFSEPILYPGSWSDWIEDSNRPIAR